MEDSSFRVTGGLKLKGELQPQGAKNEALQILSAVLLTDQDVIINNVPDIVDVNKLIDLLIGLVTGTANILMAAVLAEGKTTIYNAACEPYLQQLCNMLIRMGAKITGVGSNLLTIEGVERLGGTTHTVLPDMIEIGSFIGLAAMCQSEITIKNASIPNLGNIPSVFQKLGIKMEFRGDDIFIPEQDLYEIDTFIDGSILTIYDAPWPGFTPDLMSIVLVTATQAR
ncbi:unnamed protein product, partial [Darwinula stevensoni]